MDEKSKFPINTSTSIDEFIWQISILLLDFKAREAQKEFEKMIETWRNLTKYRFLGL